MFRPIWTPYALVFPRVEAITKLLPLFDGSAFAFKSMSNVKCPFATLALTLSPIDCSSLFGVGIVSPFELMLVDCIIF